MQFFALSMSTNVSIVCFFFIIFFLCVQHVRDVCLLFQRKQATSSAEVVPLTVSEFPAIPSSFDFIPMHITCMQQRHS